MFTLVRDMTKNIADAMGGSTSLMWVALLVIKTTLVLGVCGALSVLVRGRGAAVRHLVLQAGMVTALLLPLVSLSLPSWRVAVLPSSRLAETAPSPSPLTPIAADASPDAARTSATPDGSAKQSVTFASTVSENRVSSAPVRRTHSTAAEGQHHAPHASRAWIAGWQWPSLSPRTLAVVVAFALWALGALVVLLPFLLALASRRRLLATAAADVPAAWRDVMVETLSRRLLRSRVRVVAAHTDVPMTWGLWRPIVVVPASCHWTAEERRAAFVHELAHVERRDALSQLVGRLLCAMHWFNPLAWVISRAEQLEREQACDDVVLDAGTMPSRYAQQLLEVAGYERTLVTAAVLPMARSSNLARRLRAVLDARRVRSGRSPRAVMVTAVVTLLCAAPMAALIPTPANARTMSTTHGVVMPASPTLGEAPANRKIAARAPQVDESSSAAVAPMAPSSVTTLSGHLDRPPSTLSHDAPVTSSSPAPVPDQPERRAVSLSPLAFPGWAIPMSVGTDAREPVVVRLPETLAASSGTQAPQPVACQSSVPKKGASSSNMHLSDNSREQLRVRWKNGNCSLEFDAEGKVTVSDDLSDIVLIDRNGWAELRTDDGHEQRSVRMTRTTSGVTRDYRINRKTASWDADAARWLAQSVLALDGQTGFAIDQRYPLLMREGGVARVIDETTRMGSDYVRRLYLGRLLKREQLTAAQLGRVVTAAGSMDSDYERSELLIAAAGQPIMDLPSARAFAEITASMTSDYEKRRALSALLQRSDLSPDVAQTMLKSATTMHSDYERAELLMATGHRFVVDDSTRAYYVRAIREMDSDYEQGRVLDAVTAGGKVSPPILRDLLGVAATTMDGYELASFLVKVADRYTLEGETKQRFEDAASRLKSEYEYGRVMSAARRRK